MSDFKRSMQYTVVTKLYKILLLFLSTTPVTNECQSISNTQYSKPENRESYLHYVNHFSIS